MVPAERTPYTKPKIDFYEREKASDRYQKVTYLNDSAKRAPDEDYRKYYIERESVRRKPTSEKYAERIKHNYSRSSKGTIKHSKDFKWTKAEDSRRSYAKEPETVRSVYNQKENGGDKENIMKHDVVSVPITPVKFENSKYSYRYRGTNTIESTKVAPRVSQDQGGIEVKKSLDFASKNEEQSEGNLEDIVAQAPNPSATPNPSKSSKAPLSTIKMVPDKPKFHPETNGYLGPKQTRDAGKKTLVSKFP